MRSVESEGDSIDEAIAKALHTLGADRDRVEIEILNDASRGLFGFGGTKARVRATMRASLWSRVEEEGGAVESVPRGTLEGERPTVTGERRGEHQVGREMLPSTAEGSRREGERSTAARPPGPGAGWVEGDPRPTMAMSAAFVERCKAVLLDLLTHIGVSCTVEARPGEEAAVLVLDVTGDNGGLLIGRRGQTLDALDYLLNRIVGRGDGDHVGRVMIDVEHYRDRRRAYLDTLARRLAEKAKQTGRVVTLNPMSPRDRRVVHLALQDDAAVTTRSQGEGHYRKVLILPASGGQRGSRPRRQPG